MRFLCLIFTFFSYSNYTANNNYYPYLNQQEQDKLSIVLSKISDLKKSMKDFCRIKTSINFITSPDKEFCSINNNTAKSHKNKDIFKERIKENLQAIKNCNKIKTKALTTIKEQIKIIDSACLLGISKNTNKLSISDLKMKPVLLTIKELNDEEKARLKQNLASSGCTQVLNK